jgi:hypothetical protein
MVRRDQFVNKIRELDYSYKTQQKRTYLYRRKNSTSYISVPMADLLEDDFVSHSLRQAGCSDDSIRKFIASCKC